ncbi:DUF6311 domain-containing protein [Flavobacterium sp. DGU11]|uniref:DUF6311 domain-containing protein n=1 Tax=Flavobacterium arundinis TaxID=3139143 RepID=A0ABU9I261_9FLAO
MAKQRSIVYWGIMALVIVCFHLTYGLDIIVPTNIRWLMEAHHDWGTHYLGWAFYRDAPWSFPIGNIPDYCYPAGTNIGLTDSIVLPALLLKPFSGILPEDFQYLGLWLLLCNLMVAHYTIKILDIYKAKAVYVILAAIFVVLSPVLFFRGMHPSLCAHGFILASIYYYLKPATAATAAAINRSQVVLVLIVSLISPYLWLMIIGFTVILPLKHCYYQKLFTWKQGLKYPVIAMLGSLLLWIVVGVISFDTGGLEVQNSYGQYSFNLNSFYNPSGFSMFVPTIPWLRPEHQYEGFLYLGVGLMALAILVIGYLIITRSITRIFKNKYLIPLLVLTILLALFAITNEVSINDKVLFTYPIPKFIKQIGSTFRASGRFMWLAYYLFFIFVLVVFVKSKAPHWVKVPLLVVIVAFQIYDVKNLYTFKQRNYGSYDSPLNETRWNEIIPHYDRIITYPPFTFTLVNNMDYQDLCFLALKNKKAITLGYSARVDVKKYETYTESLTNDLTYGKVKENELYITTPQNLDAFGAIIRNKDIQIDLIDGYYLFYHKRKRSDGLKRDAATQKQLDSVRTVYSKDPGTKFVKVIKRPDFPKDEIKYNIEDIYINNNFIKISGWAFIKDKSNNKGDVLYITLSTQDTTYISEATQIVRPDITQGFNREDLSSSGFSTSVFTDNILRKDYTVGIAVKDKNDKWTFINLGTAKEIKDKKTFGNYK